MSSGLAGRRERTLLVAGVLAALIVSWTLADFFVDQVEFVVNLPTSFRGDEELVNAVVRLFGALVLVLFPADDEMGRRLHWVAGGFFILGLGYLAFGYVEPVIVGVTAALDEELYEEIFVRSAAAILFIVALLPEQPPRFRGWLAAALLLIGVAFVSLLKLPAEPLLPPLIGVGGLGQVGELGVVPTGWLSIWYWVLSAPLLGLAVVAAVGAVRQYRRGVLRGWLMVALVLWAGSLLNEYLYPAGYHNQVLSTPGVLHAAFGLVVAVGGIFELRRIGAERAALLDTERERAQRLSELAVLKADFGDMVAHELGSPLAAIRRLTEMLEIKDLDSRTRNSAITLIQGEVDVLETLVKDVRTAAAVERDDFKVSLRPVPLAVLLAEAKAFAGALRSTHPLAVVSEDGLGRAAERVMADPDRIGQVLRNLLSNATKYSPEGTLVELRASRAHGRILIEVADNGPGIRPEDLALIFEKFGRGRNADGRKIAGVGLGLYLSKRIVRNHGSDLRVRSKLGEGTVFGFDLEVSR